MIYYVTPSNFGDVNVTELPTRSTLSTRGRRLGQYGVYKLHILKSRTAHLRGKRAEKEICPFISPIPFRKTASAQFHERRRKGLRAGK